MMIVASTRKRRLAMHFSVVPFFFFFFYQGYSLVNKGVNECMKDITQAQQQRPELPMVTLTWHACKSNVHKLHQRYILSFASLKEDHPILCLQVLFCKDVIATYHSDSCIVT